MIEITKNFGDTVYKLQEFESMCEMADYIEKTPDIKEYKMTKNSYLSEHSEFLGLSCFDDVLNRLRFGDNKMTTMYLDQLKTIKSEDGEENTAYFMDIEGFGYDMGAVVAGEPECCINQGYPNTKPYLKIYIDTGYYGGVPPKTIAYRGVAIYQLISNLLAKGYILDVNFIHFIDAWGGSGGTKRVAQTVRLSTDYLVTSQIAFGGTCEFFRIVTWLLTAIQTKDKSYDGSGKSMPSKSVIDYITQTEKSLYIPSGYTDTRFNCCNQEQAIEYVAEIYNNFAEAV